MKPCKISPCKWFTRDTRKKGPREQECPRTDECSGLRNINIWGAVPGCMKRVTTRMYDNVRVILHSGPRCTRTYTICNGHRLRSFTTRIYDANHVLRQSARKCMTSMTFDTCLERQSKQNKMKDWKRTTQFSCPGSEWSWTVRSCRFLCRQLFAAVTVISAHLGLIWQVLVKLRHRVKKVTQ